MREKNLTVVCSDAHAGFAKELWGLPPEQEKVFHRSMERLVEFLEQARGELRNIVFNGDMLHAWRGDLFDPDLARRQLAPLSEKLASLGVPVHYVRGNTDDESGVAVDPKVIRTAFGDPGGEKIDLRFPGWTHQEGDALFVHGHAFDLAPRVMFLLSLAEAVPVFLRIQLHQRALFKWAMLAPNQKSEMVESLSQAVRGRSEDLLHLAQRSLMRHGTATTIFRALLKLPFPKRWLEALKDDLAELTVHGAAAYAASHMSGAKTPETVVLSHTHIPALWDRERVLQEGGGKDRRNMPNNIVNTGTVTGRTERGIATLLTLRDGREPMHYKLYDPKDPKEGITELRM